MIPALQTLALPDSLCSLASGKMGLLFFNLRPLAWAIHEGKWLAPSPVLMTLLSHYGVPSMSRAQEFLAISSTGIKATEYQLDESAL